MHEIGAGREVQAVYVKDCLLPHPERLSAIGITKLKFSSVPKTFMHHGSFYLLAAAFDTFGCIIVAASTKGWPQCLLLARRRKLIAVHFPTNGSSYSKQHIDSTKRGCSTALDNIVGEIMTEPQVWVLIFYFWPQEITIWNDDLSNQTTWSLGRCIDHTLCLRVCDHQWTVSWSLLMLLLFLVTC